MPKIKWFMKQYWRVNTFRALASLALDMFVLGRLYYSYVPGLADMRLFGAITLSVVLIVVFLGLGWVYDVKLKLWNENGQVVTERHPYQYVPDPRSRMMDYPALYAVLHTLHGLKRRISMKPGAVQDLIEYLAGYYARRAESRRDIITSVPTSEAFLSLHPFSEETYETGKNPKISTNIKKSFQTQILRLGWIQSLTGLLQDVIVFAAIYAVVFFPSVAIGNVVPIDYLMLAVAVTSVPIFIVLMVAGWYYDRILRVWTADAAVAAERNPYSYVPPPIIGVMHAPVYYSLFFFFWKNSEQLGIDKVRIERALHYLDKHCVLTASRDEDIKEWSKVSAQKRWFSQPINVGGECD